MHVLLGRLRTMLLITATHTCWGSMRASDVRMWPLLDDNTVSLEPGACAQRQGGKSCELRDVIRSDLHKWADRSIRPAQLQYSFGTSKLDNKFAGADYVDSKHWMYAAVHGRRVHFVTVGHEYGRHARTMQRMLLSLAAVAPLDDFELASTFGDAPWINRAAPTADACFGRPPLFAKGTSEETCSLALPTIFCGPSTAQKRLTNGTGDISWEAKRPLAFWRGSSWMMGGCGYAAGADRDGNGLTQLVDGQPRVRQLVDPRFLLVNASAHGSPVIDAAFSDAWEGADIRAAEVQASREDLIKVGGKLNVTVPSEEQFKYRLLPTASVPCAYTCRLVPFLSSNSLVVKFSGDAEHYTQAVCGGLRHGVHLLLATRANFGELLHAAVAPAVQPRLQRMVRNANEYMRWATSADGLHCYLHELLSGYARKLNYSVEREGAVEKLILPALGRHARDALRNKRSSPRPSPSPPGPDYKDPAKCLDNPFDFTIPTDRTTAEACAQRRFVPPDPSLVEEFKLGKNRHSGQNLPFVLSSYELPPPKLAAKDMAARCERFWARRPESKAERK
ncbi:Hypothetical protein EMIHUDRAFT_460621 [Emiliania huxleyi CCMP1516]|uniref:Glycosyl transferase CAP10 domain-containing protein n=3 Tax=Emiliania huxleyi TaxID=2903 RepID=A0A0D3KDI1_EMIH1|nr:Hypothetical protein EMIHUDRAFT_460621 [Emiliania huxleyi CCMP1516]EOD33816.1 Hypothetical protein EMIHUDRAFT_460621 [Emiliania huxleyi CCMP1516]|eukprot:XP_005786245.1 Hypothetical protein EMIHUDRAFT_460621 [Emiliania huxleyi CCMP1516]